MRPIILAGALALGAVGAASAQSTMSHSGMKHGPMAMNAAPGDAAAALPTSDYIMKAGQSDQFEIQEGQMASTMGKSPAVKNFGSMMVTEHRKTTTTLTKAVADMGQPPPSPPPLSADQQAQIDQLRGMSGADFDKTYVSQQLASHQEALTVQANYAKGGSDAKLRKVAGSTVPIVQGHLKTLTTLQAKTNGAS